MPAEGGWPTQLTISDDRQTQPAWSPNGKWIAYNRITMATSNRDIFLVSPKTGKVVNLTSTREIAEDNPAWSPDGRYLAYTVVPKTSAAYRDRYLRHGDARNQALHHRPPADQLNSDPIWSSDGKWIVYTQEKPKGTDSNIFPAEVATGKSTLLTPHRGEQLYSGDDISRRRQTSAMLITSNAATDTTTSGCSTLPARRFPGSPRTNGESAAANSPPTASTSHSAPTSTATKISICST